jgi:hypothetical protein
MQQVKDNSIEVEREIILFGEIPSLEEINQMYQDKFKGLTYQRKKGISPQVYQQVGPLEPPQRDNQPIGLIFKTPQGNSLAINPFEFKFDIIGWMGNAKIPIPLVELAKIPSMKIQIKEVFGDGSDNSNNPCCG